MKESDRVLTGYCGLYCGDCGRYRSLLVEFAEKLLGELERVRFGEYATVKRSVVKEFEDYDKFVCVLKAIKNLQCNTPCQLGGDGCAGACEFKSCVSLRGLEGCWMCDRFEVCDKFELLEPFSGGVPRENLRQIRKHGVENWSDYRGKFYKWQ